jgi:hypothetical protein
MFVLCNYIDIVCHRSSFRISCHLIHCLAVFLWFINTLVPGDIPIKLCFWSWTIENHTRNIFHIFFDYSVEKNNSFEVLDAFCNLFAKWLYIFHCNYITEWGKRTRISHRSKPFVFNTVRKPSFSEKRSCKLIDFLKCNAHHSFDANMFAAHDISTVNLSKWHMIIRTCRCSPSHITLYIAIQMLVCDRSKMFVVGQLI